MIRRRTQFALGAALLAMAAGAFAAVPAHPARATTWTVAVGNNFYDPTMITVSVGDTVRWDWPADPNVVPHSVSSDSDVVLDSPVQATGAYVKTFDTPGAYAYHCVVHPGEMTGTVIVRAVATATATATAVATRTATAADPPRTATPAHTSTPAPAATSIAVATMTAPPQPAATGPIAPARSSGGAADAGALPGAGDGGAGGAAPWRRAAVALAAIGAIAGGGAAVMRKYP
jgi:plastocyanin